ncbi:double-strand break repair helicase AddA [Woodsholea maritima]|uniref:double-strand break repair helicase AddA n=1 Tax=Woodsholea maritima TaxID=240237 RepID=UPI00036C924B|nr:double-strand break repair helicase AddA [Woodsholea maritima]
MSFDPTIIEAASAAQNLAADPRYNVFVEANAGSGKTRVLVDRVARLLLDGARPDHILCVTFTKAAAGEMQTRLFKKLGEWSTASDERLTDQLAKLSGKTPDGEELAQARRLFASALETPGGLKIQTLHAYCEGLLRRFPLEAGLPPGFATQEDRESAIQRGHALRWVLGQALEAPDGPIASAISLIIEQVGSTGLEQIISAAQFKRHALRKALHQAGDLAGLHDALAEALGVAPDATPVGIKRTAMEALDRDLIEAGYSAALTGTKPTDKKFAESLGHILAHLRAGQWQEAFAVYTSIFLTAKGEPGKKAPFTKDIAKAFPHIDDAFGLDGSLRADLITQIMPRIASASVRELSAAGLTLAHAFLDAYEQRLKQARAVDFSDLVERARALLEDSEARDWARYKLDAGLQHVLVDEAQDTAPEQWAVVRALSEDFFSGEGAQSDTIRTVFCVGDEKQSIYSFQNADPKRFIAERESLAARSEAAELAFTQPPLTASFRSAPEVLQAVDWAFALEAQQLSVRANFAAPEVKFAPTPGLAFQAYKGHQAARLNTPGTIEIWPSIPQPESPEEEDFNADLEAKPVDQARGDSARNQLAEAVARAIRDMIARGDGVWDEGPEGWVQRAVEPGDILILVRQRSSLFEEMIRRLKLYGVPVAGADRMKLPQQLVVEDLLALARFALLPEDDLSLAIILKSPAFHPIALDQPPIDDDALFDLSLSKHKRLWDKLRASEDPRFMEAKAALEAARARVDADGPYAFFATFLNEITTTGESCMARFYARLGEEARDPCEEFLSRALAFERDGAPSLVRFVHALDHDDSDIKREMEGGRNEVRVMTVHASKGLEAPVVFLPDTTKTPNAPKQGLFAHPDLGVIWANEAGAKAPLVESLRDETHSDMMAEYNRLLYVALTRARDRLIVCGARHGRAPGKVSEGAWHDRLMKAWPGAHDAHWRGVESPLDTLAVDNGWTGEPSYRYGVDPVACAPRLERQTDKAVPDWLTRPVPVEGAALRNIAPSRLFADEDEFEPASLSPLAQGGMQRFRRGSLIHKLLQVLPDLDESRWATAAARFLDQHADLSADQRDEIARETLKVLNDPHFKPIFGPGSRAEVALAGRAPGLPDHVRVNGQIDRLIIRDHEILIIDYKTNRPPPMEVEGVARVYLGQMAAYKALLSALHPSKTVRCALLWTDGPRLMELPSALLDTLFEQGSS